MELVSNDTVLQDVRHPSLRRLYDYWQHSRGQRRFPARRDIDPLDLRYAMGNILLIDVLYDPLRFRCRLHGTNLSERVGYDMTGKMVDALPGDENRKTILDRLPWLIERAAPFAVSHTGKLDDRVVRYQVLWLPLSDDDNTINMFLAGIYYDDVPSRLPPERAG